MPREQKRRVGESSGAAIRQPARNGRKSDRPVAGGDRAGSAPSPTRALKTPGAPPRDAQPDPTIDPLARLAGSYDDEPLWDELLAAIEEHRAEVNAAEDGTR